jgi:diguanylate cyclase (GGDEF)-like protein
MRSSWIRRAPYALVVLPLFTDWIDTGHWPSSPVEYLTELVLGTLFGMGVWMLNRDADRLRAYACTDALTGLPNRRLFLEDLTRAVSLARRRKDPLILVYADVDRFKSINDRFGHAAGDEVLRVVADHLAGSLRGGRDRCYRIGGDEFAALVPGVSVRSLDALLARIERVQAPSGVLPSGVSLRLSLGTCEWTPGESPEALLQRADESMYRRKRDPHRSPANASAGDPALRT